MRRALLAAILGLAALPVPLSAATAFDQGMAHYRQGRLAAAATAFTAAARTRPREAGPRFWLGIVLFRQGRHREAAGVLAGAATLAPRDGRIWLWWGHALAMGGDTAQARRVLQHVLLLAPRGASADLARQGLRALAINGARPETARGPATPALDPTNYRNVARFYNPRLSAVQADEIAGAILGYSRQYNVDPRLVVAVIAVESGFSPTARSHKGAMGLGQLMPATAAGLSVQPYDPVQNIYGTVRVLRGNLDYFGYENLVLALAAYNAGKGAVERYRGVPPYEETVLYVRNVGALYRRLRDLYVAPAPPKV